MSSYQNYNDTELIALLRDSDEAAFTEIFYRYDKRIYHFILKMVKDVHQAEEIAQEVFIRIWEKREKLHDIQKLDAYILAIAANHTLNQIKKHLSDQKMRQRLAALMEEKLDNHLEELVSLHESEQLVAKAVEALPERQKRVYHLSREEGLSYEQIAGIMDISHNTVRNHLVEALKSIRMYLENQGHISPSLIAFAILLMEK